MKAKSRILILTLVAVILVLSILLAFFLKKSGGETKVNFPEEYTVIEEDTVYRNSDFIELLGYSEESFAKHLRDKNILYFAADPQNKHQYTFSAYSTELSEQIYSVKNETDSNLQKISSTLLPKGFDRVVKSGGNVYFERISNIEGENEYVTLQYITFENGLYYTLNYYGFSLELSDEDYTTVRQVLSSIRIPDNSSFSDTLKNLDGMRIAYIIFVGIVLILGVVVVVLLSVSLIRDIRNRRERGEDFKIKRRRKY